MANLSDRSNRLAAAVAPVFKTSETTRAAGVTLIRILYARRIVGLYLLRKIIPGDATAPAAPVYAAAAAGAFTVERRSLFSNQPATDRYGRVRSAFPFLVYARAFGMFFSCSRDDEDRGRVRPAER